MFSTRCLCRTSKVCVCTSVSVESRAQIKREAEGTFYKLFKGVKPYARALSVRPRGGLTVYYQSVRDAGNESQESKRHYGYSCLVLSLGGAGGVSTPCSSTSTS